jgi:hypothetical protein
MRSITFFSKTPESETVMLVKDSGYMRDHLRIEVGGSAVQLNAVQVDKLRQVFHGWLHERANGEDGANWVEEEPEPAPYPVRR